jgi:hypothetical protein
LEEVHDSAIEADGLFNWLRSDELDRIVALSDFDNFEV